MSKFKRDNVVEVLDSVGVAILPLKSRTVLHTVPSGQVYYVIASGYVTYAHESALILSSEYEVAHPTAVDAFGEPIAVGDVLHATPNPYSILGEVMGLDDRGRVRVRLLEDNYRGYGDVWNPTQCIPQQRPVGPTREESAIQAGVEKCRAIMFAANGIGASGHDVYLMTAAADAAIEAYKEAGR